MARVRPASKSHAFPGDQWRIPDILWQRSETLLPPRPAHPLGCHNPRVPDRRAMDGIFFGLRTGCQWNALNATGICSSSSAHRRFQEWTFAGVFVNLWATGLRGYDDMCRVCMSTPAITTTGGEGRKASKPSGMRS